MEIAFDNDRRLKRRSYLLEYRGFRFKLVQDNPRRWSDHLLTVLPNGTDKERQGAFAVACEFLGALSWELRARVAVREAGGRSWHNDRRLSKARPTIFSFPRISFGGGVISNSPNYIPHVTTEEQRIALTLYREARASNNHYLSFLFLWQVLEVGGTDAEKFANKCQRSKPRELMLHMNDLSMLPLAGRQLGTYLSDEGRDAIAHIRRRSGEKRLALDDLADRRNIACAVRVAEGLAECYIRHHLGLAGQLCLMRRGTNGFPTYIGRGSTRQGRWRIAYQ